MNGLSAWDFTQVFGSDDEALAEAAELPQRARDLADRAAELLGQPDQFARLLEELGTLEQRVETLNDYARMRQYADAANTAEIAARGQVGAAAATAELGRVLDAWCALAPEAAEALLAAEGAAAAGHRLRRARELSRHRLAPAAERAWSARDESGRVRWSSLHEQLESAARIDFDDGAGERPWDLGALWGVTRRSDHAVRRAAYAAIAELAGSIADVAAVCWDAAVADRLAEDRVRGRAHPAQATLDEQELSLEGLESLVDAVWARLPARHALYRRQAALLGADPFTPADADAEPPGLPPVSAEGAWTTAVAGLGALAASLAEHCVELRANGRVDLDDREGKQSYAVTFCTGLDPPAFLSLRFAGRAANVTTLGHELGHAVALGAMQRAQPAIARGWPGVLFETPSLLGEIAAGDAMVAAAEEGHRSALRLVAVQDVAWSVFEAIAFCRVELDLYAARAAGHVLTTERILAVCREQFGALFGPVCQFGERDALVFMTAWANYATGAEYRFYNFQYTVGALCALALTACRREDEERFAADLLRFLALGRRVAPAEQLRAFGLELGSRELWERGLDELETRFAAV